MGTKLTNILPHDKIHTSQNKKHHASRNEFVTLQNTNWVQIGAVSHEMARFYVSSIIQIGYRY